MTYNYSYDNLISTMEMEAKKLASKIIMQDMNGIKAKDANFDVASKFDVILIDEYKCEICGKLPQSLDFKKHINIIDNKLYLVDNSTYGHFGVKYIIIQDDKFLKTNNILLECILVFGFLYFIMIGIGYFLAKLFLKPIIIQREKLNNFIKDTTHELNTPISAIMMSINGKDNISLKAQERIKISAKRISEIYNDLTYIFLETSKENKIIKNINLKDTLDSQIEYFQVLCFKKGISLIYKVENYHYPIDKEDFIRLSNNLISNAIKYTNKKESINVTLKEKKLIIKDTGIGISQDKQKDIFKRFYRASDDVGGFGIGLNIVQNICIKYDLKIQCESKYNKGTTFIITF